MVLYLLQPPFKPTSPSPHNLTNGGMPSPLPATKTPFLSSITFITQSSLKRSLSLRLIPALPNGGRSRMMAGVISSSMLESPVLWAGRVCLFYALIKTGLAGSPSNPIVASEMGTDTTAATAGGGGDLGFAKWIDSLRGGSDDEEAVDRRKLVSKWHPTTKGTLRRNYRVASKNEGRRILRAIASLLSDDDHFIDVTSHKGCQIRRENAHGETVCCNNVRALFDELPTPHLIVEITPFPAGPLTDKDYVKAEKLERVLRSGSSI